MGDRQADFVIKRNNEYHIVITPPVGKRLLRYYKEFAGIFQYMLFRDHVITVSLIAVTRRVILQKVRKT